MWEESTIYFESIPGSAVARTADMDRSPVQQVAIEAGQNRARYNVHAGCKFMADRPPTVNFSGTRNGPAGRRRPTTFRSCGRPARLYIFCDPGGIFIHIKIPALQAVVWLFCVLFVQL
jgi:hypothetical protein